MPLTCRIIAGSGQGYTLAGLDARPRWGSRGRRFKSCRPDHKTAGQRPAAVGARSLNRSTAHRMLTDCPSLGLVLLRFMVGWRQLHRQQHLCWGTPGGPITGERVVPCSWRNPPHGGPMLVAGDSVRVPRSVAKAPLSYTRADKTNPLGLSISDRGTDGRGSGSCGSSPLGCYSVVVVTGAASRCEPGGRAGNRARARIRNKAAAMKAAIAAYPAILPISANAYEVRSRPRRVSPWNSVAFCPASFCSRPTSRPPGQSTARCTGR